MLSAREFRRIVSGQRRDLFAICVRPVLALASLPYGLAVRHRNFRFDEGRATQRKLSVPVICVGNLTVGGTGKTPMVAYLCRWFRQQHICVAIVSRGYRSEAGKQNDEARELSARLPEVPHIQNPDRVAAATTAMVDFDSQVIVLDDGFQHRRLVRDLDLVLIDALEPFGHEWLLPRGLLREPLCGLRRAHLVALTRANLVSSDERAKLRQRVATIAPAAGWLELAHVPTQLAAGETTDPLEAIAGKRVLAFCGLGNPSGFRHTLAACGADVVDFMEFPDHHEYTHGDIESIRRVTREQQPDFVICTHKDMVKIEQEQLEGIPLRALLVEQQILHGEETLESKLKEIVASLSPSKDE